MNPSTNRIYKKRVALSLAPANDGAARAAGLRWRGDRAIASLNDARKKLAHLMQEVRAVNVDDEDYEILSRNYVAVLEALDEVRERIDETSCPTREFEIESEKAAQIHASEAL